MFSILGGPSGKSYSPTPKQAESAVGRWSCPRNVLVVKPGYGVIWNANLAIMSFLRRVREVLDADEGKRLAMSEGIASHIVGDTYMGERTGEEGRVLARREHCLESIHLSPLVPGVQWSRFNSVPSHAPMSNEEPDATSLITAC